MAVGYFVKALKYPTDRLITAFSYIKMVSEDTGKSYKTGTNIIV